MLLWLQGTLPMSNGGRGEDGPCRQSMDRSEGSWVGRRNMRLRHGGASCSPPHGASYFWTFHWIWYETNLPLWQQDLLLLAPLQSISTFLPVHFESLDLTNAIPCCITNSFMLFLERTYTFCNIWDSIAYFH